MEMKITREIRLTEEQGKKLRAIIDRKNAYHEAIRKYGPGSEQAEKIRKTL